MISDKNKQIIEMIKDSMKNGLEIQHLNDLLDISKAIVEEDITEVKYCKNITEFIKAKTTRLYEKTQEIKYLDLFWKTMLFEAPHFFESFLYYMEKNRPESRKFYAQRSEVLSVVVQDLQDLEDRVILKYLLSMPPRVGKSTICIFFLAWIMGKRPNSHNAMSGHSGSLADGFYDESLNLMTTPEYTFSEIFPGVKLQKKSAEKKEITLNDPDRFATLTCRGIDGTWTGAVDISADGYLYVDDLVRDRTESLSPRRLENRYQDYLNVLVDRKNDGARELVVGTRWNVIDPIGRIKSKSKNDPKVRIREIPALNEKGESNFNYKYNGFSTQYYLNLKDSLDKNEWEAKYQQNPFVREGLLFPEDELRTYNGILPSGGFIRNISVCDVAWGGGDSLSMPIGVEYEDGSVFIPDWIFDKGTKEATMPLVSAKIMSYKIQQINFEANNGGDMYAKYIDDFLRTQNYKCSITSTKAPSKMAKLTKIIQYSDDIKRKFIFLDEEHRSPQYQDAMDELLMFVQIGNNEHDDAPDSLAQLEMAIDGVFLGTVTAGKIEERIY